MKLILTFTTALFIQLYAAAADSVLVFRQVPYSQVFELAKKEKKAVLLYFHFDGCGACAKMEKTAFIDKKVADLYNTNFICLEVNTRKGEGIETNNIYTIELHPTYLFLDENGNILHKIVGVFSPDEFVLQARNALHPTKTLAYLRQQYKNGNRDPGFLLDYCYRLRDANELDSFVINEYLATQVINDLNKEKNIRFIYEFCLYNGRICIPFNSPAYHFMDSGRMLFDPFFEREQTDTRLMFIAMDAAYAAIERKDKTAFREAIDALKKYDNGKEYTFKELDGRITMWANTRSLILMAEMTFYERSGEQDQYNNALKEYLGKIWNDYEELNTFAWNCYEKYDDKTRLEKAAECVQRSIKLNNNYANNDTYTCLLYKLNRYDKALKQAEKAITLAKQKNLDYKETTELVEKIKDKQKK